MQRTITLDMTIDRADFFRLLPGAVAERDYQMVGDRITQGDAAQGWTLDLLPLAPLPIGHLAMPRLRVELHDRVDIDATLPDGAHLNCPGEVRHITHLEDQAYPTRLGVVLTPPADMDMEPIHRFIQARRTDRSHTRAL